MTAREIVRPCSRAHNFPYNRRALSCAEYRSAPESAPTKSIHWPEKNKPSVKFSGRLYLVDSIHAVYIHLLEISVGMRFGLSKSQALLKTAAAYGEKDLCHFERARLERSEKQRLRNLLRLRAKISRCARNDRERSARNDSGPSNSRLILRSAIVILAGFGGV